MADMKTMEVKLAAADAALRKVTEYVAVVQPKLDEVNEKQAMFVKRAHQIVGILVNKGMVPKHRANDLVDKMASDQTVALDVIEKVANMVSAPLMGAASDEKLASGMTYSDPFERLAVTGSVNVKQASSGMVE